MPDTAFPVAQENTEKKHRKTQQDIDLQTDNISQILWRRINGEAVAKTAEDLGLSRTYIYDVLSRIPKCQKPGIDLTQQLPQNVEFQIAMDCLSILPSVSEQIQMDDKKKRKKAIAANVVHQLSQKYQLSESMIWSVFARINSLHPAAIHYPLYSKIESWKTRNIITFKELANEVGRSPQELRDIMRGLQHMPLPLARRISGFTGLKIRDIYSDLIELDKQENQGH